MLQQFHSLVYTKENKNTNLKKKKMFTAALFRIDKIWKQPKCSSQIKKIWYAVFSHSFMSDSVTQWTAARQASLSITNSQSLPRLMSIDSVMPSNHLILCHPLLLPSIFPRISIFYKGSVLHIRWPKYWSFSFSIIPSKEYSGLISFRMA